MIRYRTPLVALAHGALFTLALLSAFLLAYNFRWRLLLADGAIYDWFVKLYVPFLCLSLPSKLFAFHILGQYRSSWRYVGLRDLAGVLRASLVGSFIFIVAYFLTETVSGQLFGDPAINRAQRLPESSVFLIDWASTVVFVCAARVLFRFYHEEIRPARTESSSRVLIVGAGNAGEALLRELLRMSRDRYLCLGFLDDNAPALRSRIHGVEVLGRLSQIAQICREKKVHEVFIAMDHATPRMIRSLVEQCQGTGVLFRTIPTMTDLMAGRFTVSQIRDVEISDLLGREPVSLDTDEIAKQLRGRRTLVTGAGGSIGSEMCRQIAGFEPERLILVEQAENGLFEIERELQRLHPTLDVTALIADVADQKRIEAILQAESPSILFHAAAHKHVPMMETNPGEAIKNNIGGTAVVAHAAIAAGVEKMVLISTDKAVNPTSMMGCTKRVAEMYLQSLGGRGVTQFVTVRFGNVLGSSGSVVPIFKQQIAAGGPVTVTDPNMKRYFMTITEAAQLVLQAGAMANGGEVYILHMGEPVRIVDLATDMITLSGLRPGRDIEIKFTGIRPGEKLFEELSFDHEDIGDTAHPKIGIWKHRSSEPGTLRASLDQLLAMADTVTDRELRAKLMEIVPEYAPSEKALPTVETPEASAR
ncbi:MAG: polysaccharide biosynthesis protein [Planctomycetes bacterium]|nr:polysaccharide biosynthesis protein [Planctomycetota bacterium]